jgi:hypothetical protein
MENRAQPAWRRAAQLPLLVAMLLIWLAPPAGALNSDWHLWLNQSVGWNVTSNSFLQLNQSFRLSSEPTQLVGYYLEGGYVYGWKEWLDVAAFYREQYSKSTGEWRQENRPFVDVTPRVKFGEFTLFDRNRLEYRRFADEPDTARYRNKLALQFNGDLLEWGLKPYVAVEAFVSESANMSNRDQMQFTFGIRTDPEEHMLKFVKKHEGYKLNMDHFFILQRVRRENEWVDQYILGLSLGIFF